MARDGVGFREILVALEIELSRCQQRLVAFQRALGEGERKFIGARVDLRQEIALLDDIAIREVDFRERSADLRTQFDLFDGRKLA